VLQKKVPLTCNVSLIYLESASFEKSFQEYLIAMACTFLGSYFNHDMLAMFKIFQVEPFIVYYHRTMRSSLKISH